MMKFARNFFVVCMTLLALQSSNTVFAKTTVFANGFFTLGAADVLDDVLITDNAIVLLLGSTITGDINVTSGGVLAASGILVGGKVESEGAFLIDITNSEIGRGIEIEETGGAGDVFGLLPSIDILKCKIGGNVEVSENDVNFIDIKDNVIRGKLKVKDNVTVFPIDVSNNVFKKK